MTTENKLRLLVAGISDRCDGLELLFTRKPVCGVQPDGAFYITFAVREYLPGEDPTKVVTGD